VAGSLLNKDKKYMQVIFGRSMMRLEKHFESFARQNFLTIEQARKNKLDWDNFTAVKPNVIGEQVIEVDLDVLVPTLDSFL
jgi:5-methyltetrahydrofolate--homocysteine methyltransferase